MSDQFSDELLQAAQELRDARDELARETYDLKFNSGYLPCIIRYEMAAKRAAEAKTAFDRVMESEWANRSQVTSSTVVL